MIVASIKSAMVNVKLYVQDVSDCKEGLLLYYNRCLLVLWSFLLELTDRLKERQEENKSPTDRDNSTSKNDYSSEVK